MNRLVKTMNMTKAILTQPSTFWMKIPVLRKQLCIIMMAVSSPTAKAFNSIGEGSRSRANKTYSLKTIQFDAVNPRSTDCTAMRTDARNRGRR